ncbi:PadR family transcriptional regulator [Paludibacterium yongneupense]|uniref:PadR family transcriptional regulator n=1 Tax=Paludibacterium yongneupense TaxID=400061 RepID=UPI000420015C|nr:PadR family transcriptional regulator [Paludibacterium yongneupense]
MFDHEHAAHRCRAGDGRHSDRRHAMAGSHHRHDGGMPFGDGRFGDGMGDGGGMHRGRKFSSDDLQLLLLALLEEAPRHGYELIKLLAARSNGFYSPSPGMVYPALTWLEDVGYATVEATGNRKCYRLAPAGRDYLAAHREHAQLMLARLSHIARKMDSVRRAYAGEDPSADPEAWLPELVAARRALKKALLLRDDAPADEQRRIAAILARATAEIESGSPSSFQTGASS